MPTVTALVAGNFTGQQRARAYGLIAASAAVAVAAGPIIGGFVTANFSWRWVFAAEVVIAGGLLLGSARIPDVAVGERPKLDGVGALLSAAGLAMIVLGVLQSSSWGWVRPRIADGPDATPQIAGISLTAWLILAGLVVLWMLVEWLDHIQRRLLHHPAVLVDRARPRRVRHRHSHAAVVTRAHSGRARNAALRAECQPTAGRAACLLLLAGAALLLAALLGENPADASIVTVPFLLLGAGLGLLAPQLGNVIVSSEPVERSGEVGGLQYTAQNLGASLGTALIGAVIGTLATQLLQGIEDSPAVSDPVEQAAGIQIEAGVEFVSDAQLEAALAQTPLAPE